MDQVSLAALVAARLAAKRAEDAAIAHRREVDQAIAERLARDDKPEGVVSQDIEGFKVAVTYGFNRKVDADALLRDWQQLPAPITAAFRWKPEIITGELRKLDAAQTLAAGQYVTTSPASPQVRIQAV